MKERPILFSAPMVRAILDGSKTQTRRVVKPRADRDMGPRCVLQPHELAGEVNGGRYRNSIYGQPGDRLWVRETWAETDRHDGTPVVAYRAGGCIGVGRTQRDGPDHLIRAFAWDDAPEGGIRWRASIHMPRWASRILLEITDARVERVQDISDRDARDEGAEQIGDCEGAYVAGFRRLWESINGPDSWAANPWVWVVEFRRIEP